MERLFLFCASVFLMVALVAGCGSNGDNVGIMSVRGIQTNSAAYQGKVTIAGVVAMVSQKEPKIFAVVDFEDIRGNVPPRKRLYLPVRYEGAAPRVGDPVNLTGSFGEGMKYFAATNIALRR